MKGGNDTVAFETGEPGGDFVADYGNGDSLLFIGFGSIAQGATFTQVGATKAWRIHFGSERPQRGHHLAERRMPSIILLEPLP